MKVYIEDIEFSHSDDEQVERSRFGHDQSQCKMHVFVEMANRRHEPK